MRKIAWAKFIWLCNTEKNPSIYESMILWRKRLVFRHYIKKKRHKYVIKLFELCTHNGFVLTAKAYGGQEFQDPDNLGQTGAIVLKLMKSYLNKGYHVFTVELREYLSSKSTYITGTLRKDRKSNPKEVITRNHREWSPDISIVYTFVPVDTGRKLSVYKTFRRRPGRLLNVLCTFSLRPVSMGM